MDKIISIDQVSVIAEQRLTGMESTLLSAVDLQVQSGQWLQIIGANGSGKSTLIRLITAQLGMNLRVVGSVNRCFGAQGPIPYVMQHPEASILGTTPLEDVVIGLEQQGYEAALIERRAIQALTDVGLGAALNLPVVSLSGGQKQLTALASCLAIEANLLVFDEACSMLDAEARSIVLEKVRELHRRGKTIIWVTHRMQEWRATDRIIAMEAGAIVYDGGVGDFFRRCGLETGEVLTSEGRSVCERLGYSVPYTVETALELERRGWRFDLLPVMEDELAKAVNACR